MDNCSKIDAENEGSDFQDDSSTDIVNSSDTALHKSEIKVIQVNNGARRAPAASEFMDVGMTEKSEINRRMKVIRVIVISRQRSWIWKA